MEAAYASMIVAVFIAVATLIYVIIPRTGRGYLSRLTCPRCSRTFDYRWMPGGSFSSVRLGRGRYMQCPRCHEWSTFDIASSRVKADRQAPT